MHFQTWKYFARMRNELMGYLKQPTNTFSGLPKSNESSFITCVHIRRTDFVNTGFHVPDYDFIIGALRFVEEKERREPNVKMSHVFFSDDIEYVKSLWNVTFVLKNGIQKSLQNDSYISQDDATDSILYASRHCDVVYFTAPHSTFGWWMGYLSKGNQVYYTDIKFVQDNSIPGGQFNPDDYYPPHWTPVKYEGPDNATVIESLK
uniref:L-Fucosyltransferase n=1 Tax=Caenorhabditis tropicalis TaxID=1561998 RepID=A0A1I7TW06_9PELO